VAGVDLVPGSQYADAVAGYHVRAVLAVMARSAGPFGHGKL
jgi:hypothetical protein